jgi:hypothetical protein
MKKIYFLMFVLVQFPILRNCIFAQTQLVPVTFGATFFGNYDYTIIGIDGRAFSKFDIDRLYFTAKTQISDGWKLQMTTDVYRNSASGSYYSGLSIRLKFGFFDYSPLQSLSIKFGMIPGPWNGVVETQWKYRGVAPTASDKYGYIATADLGVSVCDTLPGKVGVIAGYILNGDGYTSPETNKTKDVVLSATIYPFVDNPVLKSLTLAGISYIGYGGTTAPFTKNRFGGLLGYGYSFASFGVEYDYRADVVKANSPEVHGDVYSIFGELKVPVLDLESKLSIILRYDSSDPDKTISNDNTNFFTGGIAWKANDKVTLVVDRQILSSDTPSIKENSGALLTKDDKWFFNVIIVI